MLRSLAPGAPLPQIRPLHAALALLVAWMALLWWQHGRQQAPLVVVWTTPAPADPPADPQGRLRWASQGLVEEQVAALISARAPLPTLRLEARPQAYRYELQQREGLGLALCELPGLEELPRLAEQLRQDRPALVVVASPAPPEALLTALPGDVVVLPGAFSEAAAAGTELRGGSPLVGPWVDSRYRMGVLELRGLGDELQLVARSVELPRRQGVGGPGRLGQGGLSLHHDTVRYARAGLSPALGRRMAEATGAEAALLNYLALRGGLEGEVDLPRLLEALPFHNELVLLTLDELALAQILEAGAEESTRYLVAVDRRGSPLSPPSGPLRVVTLDYLANGGRGGWPQFLEGRDRRNTGIYLDDLAVELLQ